MGDFKNSLLSRKLWITISSFLIFVLNEQYVEALTVVLVYLGVQGGADVAQAIKTTNISADDLKVLQEATNEDFSAVDHTGKLVSGRTVDEDDEDQV